MESITIEDLLKDIKGIDGVGSVEIDEKSGDVRVKTPAVAYHDGSWKHDGTVMYGPGPEPALCGAIDRIMAALVLLRRDYASSKESRDGLDYAVKNMILLRDIMSGKKKPKTEAQAAAIERLRKAMA